MKPIALHMVAEIARSRETAGLPISGIGGITDWRDAVDFLALGASTVQVCTAAMVYGFKIIDDLVDGLANYLDTKGFSSVRELVGKAVPSVTDWQYLNLNHVDKAWIDQDLVHQVRALLHRLRRHLAPGHHGHRERHAALRGDRRRVRGLQSVRQCLPGGKLHHHAPDDRGIDPRTGRAITHEKADWTTHPNNPGRKR